MAERPVHVLVSFAWLNKLKGKRLDAVLDKLFRPDWKVMLDSGAFSNYTQGKKVVSFDEYTAFLKEHDGRFWHAIAYDVIGDMVKSDANVKRMQDMGLDPVPVFQRSGTVDQLKTMLADHDVVAVGGISRRSRERAEQDYLRQVMRIVGEHKVHLLGLGWKSAERYRPYSLDCTSPFVTTRYGVIHLWTHRGWIQISKQRNASRGGKNYIKPDLQRTSVLRSYGLTWAALGKKDAYKDGGDATVATLRSWVRHANLLDRNDVRFVFALPWTMQAIDGFTDAWNQERQSWGWADA